MIVVGREREIDALADHLASARGGRGSAVAVIGEPGIGKTTLVSTLATRARDAGGRVLWGRCTGLGSQSLLGPIAQAFAALLDEGVLDANLVRACGGGLLAIVPEAAHLAPELMPPAGADPETIAFAVTRAATRLLRQVCLQRPHLLVIDDMHDADPATLRLLARLAQEARTMPLLIAMTAREGELGTSRHATEVAELSRDLAWVRVGALDREAGVALVQQIAPALGGDHVDRVLAAADGNPLYLCELAALLGARANTDEAALPIPLGIKASIRSRLDRLPADTRAVVDALAVLGGHAPLHRAASVAGVSWTAATPAIEVGLVSRPTVEPVVRLSHALVRDVAYAELAEPRRQAFHRNAAELAAVGAARGEHDAATEQVRHLAACGAVDAAIDAALIAARQAELRAADDEALSILEIVSSGTTDASRHVLLTIARGRAELRCGRSEAGIATCVRAGALAEQIGDPELFAAAALARGSVFRFGHVDRGLVDALRRAMEMRPERDDATQARLLARLASAEQPSLDPWKFIAMAHRAVGLARSLGDEQVLLDVLHDGAGALVDFEDPRIRVGIDRDLRELARRRRAPWYEMRALTRLVYDHADVGDVSEADAAIDALDGIARSFAHPRHQWRVSLLRAMRATCEGNWAAADRHGDEAIALGGDDPLQAYALFGHRLARFRVQERADDAVQLLEDERELLIHVPKSSWIISTMQAAVAARAGDHERVRRVLPEALGVLAFDDVGLMAMFAEAAAAVGDVEACAAVLPKLAARAHRFASGGPMFMYVADPLERYLGLVAARLGDRPRAIVSLESAIERLRAARSMPYVARTSLELADLLGTGTPSERDRAALLRAEAKALCDQFELGDLRARSELTQQAALALVPEATGFTLVREGEAWAIANGGKTIRLRDTRGLQILARLIEQPGVDFHALDLVDTAGTIDRGDAGEVIDARGRSELRARLIDLRDDLAEAERRSDLGWIDRLRSESEMIQAQLARAFGLGGRARRTGAAAERARSAVTRRVREAIAKITEHDADLGEHLAWAVRTGMTCSYRGNRK